MKIRMELPSNILFVGGTVNGQDKVAVWEGGNSWAVTADQAPDDLYRVDMELVDAAGNRSRYTDTVRYALPVFVCDRTKEDVDRRSSKAYLNASDLTRIEGNMELIAGYLGIKLPLHTNWQRQELPRKGADFKRILDNTELIRSGYAVRSDTPGTPEQPLNTWRKWNDIERILRDVYWLYFGNRSQIEYCGEIYTEGE